MRDKRDVVKWLKENCCNWWSGRCLRTHRTCRIPCGYAEWAVLQTAPMSIPREYENRAATIALQATELSSKRPKRKTRTTVPRKGQ